MESDGHRVLLFSISKTEVCHKRGNKKEEDKAHSAMRVEDGVLGVKKIIYRIPSQFIRWL